ncbi:GTP-binding protein A [Echria macrotheca]|uniref:GTP-binding protein A n=1 Tax=Echria macrotheca TaxID=438768 RepID=A0AAJ0F3T3_9PEZI|nr:GTP-binding protein A [Echria macrotheca]
MAALKLPSHPSRPVMVVIVGMTGAGKSTFTSLASGQQVKIGDGLEPCTQDPRAVRFMLDEREVILIDTPGFDDSQRNDLEILEDIAKWMAREGLTKNHSVDGLILLHPITDLEDSRDREKRGLEKRRTRLIQSILGPDAYERVVIATTMWGVYDSWGEKRAERMLRFRREYGVWRAFCAGGATVTKHDNTPESAHTIIRSIMDKSRGLERVDTLLQRELDSNNGGRFTDTTLGKELKKCLEEEISRIEDEILKHRKSRPDDRFRKSRDYHERWLWKDWEEQNQNLTKDLEHRLAQLKRLNSFYSRLLQFWSKMFTSR